MTSANGGTYAGQYTCDGCVDNLKPTTDRWRVQMPTNVPRIERFQRYLPTPPFSLRVLPPLFWTKASQNLASLKKGI